MLELLKGILFNPTLSVIAAFFFMALLTVYRLHPERLERKRKISIDVFDRLCDAYSKYDPKDDVARARLEFATEEYCRTHVDHRLADMAFRSESATRVLNDLRRLPNAIIYEDGEFRTALHPYTFPTHKNAKRNNRIALAFYILASSMLAGGMISIPGNLLSSQTAVAVMILSLIPGMFCAAFLTSSIKQKRLARVAALIRESDHHVRGG